MASLLYFATGNIIMAIPQMASALAIKPPSRKRLRCDLLSFIVPQNHIFGFFISGLRLVIRLIDNGLQTF